MRAAWGQTAQIRVGDFSCNDAVTKSASPRIFPLNDGMLLYPGGRLVYRDMIKSCYVEYLRIHGTVNCNATASLQRQSPQPCIHSLPTKARPKLKIAR